MTQPLFSQGDAEQVQKAANELCLLAPKLVGENKHPILALAALTMAACHGALFMEVPFTQLLELVSMHYRAASAAMAVEELEEQLGQHLSLNKLPEGEPS
jgi:hypothetical protein